MRQQLTLPTNQTHLTESVQLEYTDCEDYIREKFEMETLPQLNMPFKQDSLFPIQGIYEAVERISPIYELLDRPDLPVLHIHDARHEISGDCAYDWLDSHLSYLFLYNF